MCYTRRKIQGGVGALRESDDTNFLEPNGQSRNLNVYDLDPINSLVSRWDIGSLSVSSGSKLSHEFICQQLTPVDSMICL